MSSTFCSNVDLGEQIAEETMDLKAKELETVTEKLASADTLNLELKHTMHKLFETLSVLGRVLHSVVGTVLILGKVPV